MKKRQTVAQKERARKAVDLKIAGASWPQIAAELGMDSESGPRLLVARYFELTAKAQLEEMRPIVLERCELLWRRAWNKLNQVQQANGPIAEWDKAMTQCLNVLQQLSRITGLANGPAIQINVTTVEDVRSLRDEFYTLRGITPPVVDADETQDENTPDQDVRHDRMITSTKHVNGSEPS